MQVNCPDWQQSPGSPYSINSTECAFRTTITSDLSVQTADGWLWPLAANQTATAYFAIVPQVYTGNGSAVPPAVFDAQLAAKTQAADAALRARLAWAEQQLPVLSNSSALEPFYYRCVLSVLNARWTRENFFISPFYAVGTWVFSVLWDTSFASGTLTMLEPAAVRSMLLAFAQLDLMK